MAEELVGAITHFYAKISVVIIKLSGTLGKSDEIRIKGKDTDFSQKVESMQIEHKEIKEAKAGQEIGMKVTEPAKEGCQVYKVTEEM